MQSLAEVTEGKEKMREDGERPSWFNTSVNHGNAKFQFPRGVVSDHQGNVTGRLLGSSPDMWNWNSRRWNLGIGILTDTTSVFLNILKLKDNWMRRSRNKEKVVRVFNSE